jgi:2-polyprenyl-3-methyl-5-hydroxy-6-metoxy-1,4-benzoquinol methylase
MLEIKKLPLYFKAHRDNNNGGFTQEFPFDLFYDEKLHMLRQKPSVELNNILHQIYKCGSLVEGSTSSESGKLYIEKLVNYLFKHFDISANSSILEVGFGSGALLKELKNKGIHNLYGIEPGDHERVEVLDGIKLIKDYFPSQELKEKFDLIFSFGILEHI